MLKELLHADRKQDLEDFLWGMEVIDFLNEHPSVKFSPEEFVGLLTKLQPRLYSVASSLRAYPEQVHFIVDVVRYESHGRVRKGVCSIISGGTRGQCSGAGLSQLGETFSSARRRQYSAHHDRAGHGHRAVPRLPARSTSDSARKEKTGSSSERNARDATTPTRRISINSSAMAF